MIDAASNPHSALPTPHSEVQLELTAAPPLDENVKQLIAFLAGRDWISARQIALELKTATGLDVNDRQIRNWANASRGEIGGGQHGYKLIRTMTHEEYNHWRNWMMAQAREMERRVLEADRVWYQRRPAP